MTAPAPQSPPSGDEGEVDEIVERLLERIGRWIMHDDRLGRDERLMKLALGQIKALNDRATTAERERDEARAEAADLRDRLGKMSCPRPCNGRSDDLTVADCIAFGECGCLAHVAALNKEQPS